VETPEKVLHKYQKERHAAHVAISNRFDDLAFKTSERYDQWILTLSGGALAISLTFLEKIAPEPTKWTLFLLGLSWLAYIVAILAGFYAIYFSREAIYEEMRIADGKYQVFISTSAVDKMMGDQPPAGENKYTIKVSRANKVSSACLVAGTVLLCGFALVNLGHAPSSKESPGKNELEVKLNFPPSVINYLTNTTTGPTMRKEPNKPVEIKSVTPSQPDGSIKGIHVGDPSTAVQGSYKPPTSQAPIPPPPTPKK